MSEKNGRKKEKCSLTILICSYNSHKFLRRCLDSLTRQNECCLPYEIIFIDDCSKDGSPQIAKAYAGVLKNFRLLRNKKNLGLVNACNKAISVIRTDYFVRLDSDDFLSPGAVKKIFQELMSQEEKDIILFNRWDVFGNKVKKVKISNDIYTWIAAGNVFKTECARAVGGYSRQYWEEYDFYIKLLEAKFNYKISPHHIYFYQRGHRSMTGNSYENKKGFENLKEKWGCRTLIKYGNPKKVLDYYS